MRATSRHSRVVASSAIVTGRAHRQRAAELALAGERVGGAVARALLHRAAPRARSSARSRSRRLPTCVEYSDSGVGCSCDARAIRRRATASNTSPSATANHSVASRVSSVAASAVARSSWRGAAHQRERHRALGDAEPSGQERQRAGDRRRGVDHDGEPERDVRRPGRRRTISANPMHSQPHAGTAISVADQRARRPAQRRPARRSISWSGVAEPAQRSRGGSTRSISARVGRGHARSTSPSGDRSRRPR